MKEKNQRISSQLMPNIFRALLVCLLLFGFAYSEAGQQESTILIHSSGDDEIDQIRRDIKIHPTDESNYLYREGKEGQVNWRKRGTGKL